jgi:hypothetical protein
MAGADELAGPIADADSQTACPSEDLRAIGEGGAERKEATRRSFLKKDMTAVLQQAAHRIAMTDLERRKSTSRLF